MIAAAMDSIMKNMAEPCFRINSPSVIYERFDEELVAIHLDSGTYHSMMGAAADAFVLLAEEATAAELADALTTRYAAPSGEIHTALMPFMEHLQNEQLIALVEQRKPRVPSGSPEIRAECRSSRRLYKPFTTWRTFCCWTRFTKSATRVGRRRPVRGRREISPMNFVPREHVVHHIAAATRFPGPGYYDVLRRLHEDLRPESYVEIGVRRGRSLKLAMPPTMALGIDPFPDVDDRWSTQTRVLAMTSSEFFAKHTLRSFSEPIVFHSHSSTVRTSSNRSSKTFSTWSVTRNPSRSLPFTIPCRWTKKPPRATAAPNFTPGMFGR